MGVIPASSLRSATAVADLNERLRSELVGQRGDAVRALDGALTKLSSLFDLPVSADRRRTAQAAAQLVNRILQSKDQAVEALAALDVPTTASAIGTSIKQAASVVAELDRFNFGLLQSVSGLRGVFESDAHRIIDRLNQAALADELTLGLVQHLLDAERAATDLLGEVAASQSASTSLEGDLPATVDGQPNPAPAGPASAPIEQADSVPTEPAPINPEERRNFLRLQAEEQLQALRDRLRLDAELVLTWEIGDSADADG
jgi:NAD-dependent DNA ligase